MNCQAQLLVLAAVDVLEVNHRRTKKIYTHTYVSKNKETQNENSNLEDCHTNENDSLKDGTTHDVVVIGNVCLTV